MPSSRSAIDRPRIPPSSGARRARLSVLLIPPLAIFALLYHVMANLQITVLRPQTIVVIGASLGAATLLGVLAAWSRSWLRVGVLTLIAVIWIDATFDLSAAFVRLTPDARSVAARDRTRLADLIAIQSALERHIDTIGPLPAPADYGEETGAATFWQGWWDESAHDGNGDGRPFLEFLVDRGLMTSVPVDPINRTSADSGPAHGQQYVYYVAPPGYGYAGGHCGASAQSVYLLGITDLERETTRPPAGVGGSGCDCLWRAEPNFFQQHFDYVVCGRFPR